ncbi:hypothetical protein BH10CYA1_BH10CYA1_03810 [soil metagenome]
MSENKPSDDKSKKPKPVRKPLVKVKKLTNTSDLTGTVGGQSGAGGSVRTAPASGAHATSGS